MWKLYGPCCNLNPPICISHIKDHQVWMKKKNPMTNDQRELILFLFCATSFEMHSLIFFLS